MAASYQLRCQLFGHEKDVRAVAPAYFPESAIVSGSRDLTTRVWVPLEGGLNFIEGHCMSGHSNFVASVCCMPPDDKYPHGLMYTGSNDTTINAYSLDSPTPVFTLHGHTSTVCSLASGKFGTLLSGSWDKTAKVWLHQKCVMTLEGHEAAVWAVAILPDQGVMLTGSADKTIKVWKAGKCERTIKGHSDCVRGLAVTQSGEFLSCSNDATIRRWLVSGDCLAVYYGHENFVYSIAVLPNGQDFVSSGEDRTVRVWKNGECKQTITHPTISVWTVCTLANGDIVSGASDSTVRVFTSDPLRIASTDELKAYNEQIAASQVTGLGDIDQEKLEGPEGLNNPGTKDGQTKMIKAGGGKVELYSWDGELQQWKKVGDVVGSSGGTNATSGKTLYEGKEYDYVFTVDITEGQPPLKLPYNITDDPWFAAQTFLDKNNLSQLFLDQVANFIVDNTKGATMTQTSGSGGIYVDPFTGGSRYVPGSNNSSSMSGSDPFTGEGRYIPGSAPSAGGGGTGLDPLTGGGRYIPTYTDSQRPGAAGAGDSSKGDPVTGASSYRTDTLKSGMKEENKFYPQKNLLTFDAVNPAQIMGKLREFNNSIDPSKKQDEAKLNSLEAVMTGNAPTDETHNTLKAILGWPDNFVFPALDILRVTIKQPETNPVFCATKDIQEDMLKYWSPSSTPATQILSLKVVCNMFGQPQGYSMCMSNRDQLISTALNLKMSQNKNVQIGLGTLLLNISVGLFGSLDLEGKSQTMAACAEVLKNKPDNEAAFRLFVAMGTLIFNDESLLNLAQSMGIRVFLGPYLTVPEPRKVSECALFLSDLLQ